jgi:hypothetical protein
MVAGSTKASAGIALFAKPRQMAAPKSVNLFIGLMNRDKSIFGHTLRERALALLACSALLYFAAGGSLFHQHTNGSEIACHICQTLHMPALAAAALGLVAAPELIARLSSLPRHVAPSNSVSLHRASRAPPSA